jgi:inner membrane protein
MENTYDPATDRSENQPFWQRYATTIKGIIIFFLMLILLIPVAMVEDIIREREGRQVEAIQEVSSKWGNSQSLVGPILTVPYEKIYRNAKGEETGREQKTAYLLPEQLTIDGGVQPETRHRGIFDVVLYGGKMTLDGIFQRPELSQWIPEGATVQWNKANIVIGIPDLRGLNDQVKIQWNGQTKYFEPGIPVSDIAASGIHVDIPLKPDAAFADSFHIELSLKGSGHLYFTPVGKVTDVHLAAPWPDPSFTGNFLPESKTTDATGFDARWRVLHLNRNYPQYWNGEQSNTAGAGLFVSSEFGVDFFQPVDNYQKATRSAKYAILFISLTFLAVFFIEMRQNQPRKVHPFQYTLIGMALVIFYTLLVSISEHISYNKAYLVSALMTVVLTGLYARSLFNSGRMALLVSGTLTILYGFLFVVLQQADYALLIGSVGLFIILAVIMYVSRKIEID